MAETQPIWMQALCYNYNELRNQFDVCGEGVVNKFGGSLLVASSGAADHSITVAAGSAWVDADGPNVDGMYRVTNDAPVTLQLAAGGGGNGRVDTIIATVHDSQSSGVDDDWVLTVVTGTPNAAAVSPLTDAGITASAGAVPVMSVVLGYVLVPVADTLTTTISAVNIVDGRNNYFSCDKDPCVVLTASAATTGIASATATKVNLATVTRQDRDYFTVAASIVTIVQAGLYDLSAFAAISGTLSSTANQIIAFGRNGTTELLGSSTGPSTTSVKRESICLHDYPLGAGDTIQLVIAATTTAGTVTAQFDAASGTVARLSIRKVG